MMGQVELTSLCYGAGCLLYSGTNTGQVCAWDTTSNRCFMTWEADEGEIGESSCDWGCVFQEKPLHPV